MRFSPAIVQWVQLLLGGKARGWEVPSAGSKGDLKPDGAPLVWDFLVYGDLLDLTMARGL